MSQMGQKREFLFSGDISASDSCGHWPEGTVARLRDNRFAVCGHLTSAATLICRAGLLTLSKQLGRASLQ
jgi:hypothetical protein